MAVKSLSIRIDDKMLDKLHYVADYEGRSANSQILVLIRNCIKKFEDENGEIEFGVDLYSSAKSAKISRKKDSEKK